MSRFTLLLVLGCGADKDSDTVVTGPGTSAGTTGGTTTTGCTSTAFYATASWADDGLVPTDSDGDGFPDTGCGDSVVIDIIDPLGVLAWEFGMAETDSASGWLGEDCFNGSGAYALCHPIGIDHTLDEVATCAAADVLPGTSTLLDASRDAALTYYLSDGTSCFVWGHDVDYYLSLGCFDLTSGTGTGGC